MSRELHVEGRAGPLVRSEKTTDPQPTLHS